MIIEIEHQNITSNASIASEVLVVKNFKKEHLNANGKITNRAFTVIKEINKNAFKVNMKTTSKLEMHYYDNRDIMKSIFEYLPMKFYGDSKEVLNIMKAKANAFIKLNYDIQDVLLQCFPSTATWGLDRWEQLFDIQTDYGLSYEERRKVIQERIEGHYTVTVDFLSKESNRFYPSYITQDVANFNVFINITSREKIDEGNLEKYEKFMKRMRDLIPSHLDIEIFYDTVVWREFIDADIRWGDISKRFSWGELSFQFYHAPSHKMDDIDKYTWQQIESKIWEDLDSYFSKGDDSSEL